MTRRRALRVADRRVERRRRTRCQPRSPRRLASRLDRGAFQRAAAAATCARERRQHLREREARAAPGSTSRRIRARSSRRPSRQARADVAATLVDRLQLFARDVRIVRRLDDDADERAPREPHAHERAARDREPVGNPVVERRLPWRPEARRARSACVSRARRAERAPGDTNVVVFEILTTRRSNSTPSPSFITAGKNRSHQLWITLCVSARSHSPRQSRTQATRPAAPHWRANFHSSFQCIASRSPVRPDRRCGRARRGRMTCA